MSSRCCNTRTCNRARKLLARATLEALDSCLLRRPLACSWRLLSKQHDGRYALPYIRERPARARAFGCHCSCARLSLSAHSPGLLSLSLSVQLLRLLSLCGSSISLSLSAARLSLGVFLCVSLSLCRSSFSRRLPLRLSLSLGLASRLDHPASTSIASLASASARTSLGFNFIYTSVRGQVPGTTRDEARTKSAITNYQASGNVRAERECRGIEWNLWVEYPEYLPESPRTR